MHITDLSLNAIVNCMQQPRNRLKYWNPLGFTLVHHFNLHQIHSLLQEHILQKQNSQPSFLCLFIFSMLDKEQKLTLGLLKTSKSAATKLELMVRVNFPNKSIGYISKAT